MRRTARSAAPPAHRRAAAGLALVAAVAGTLLPARAVAQDPDRLPGLPAPADAFGFEIGDDYRLANYQQLAAYWQRLAAASDRMVLDTIGTTEEGRPQLMAILTSPENHTDLERYRGIAERMARARSVGSEDEARRLAEEGKAVVWIDGGLHATEVLGAQQLIELVWDMASRTDDETLRFLDDVILLAVHANPDGHDLVADWYMRRDEPTERSASWLPRLYQKYAGHDNNRDFYFAALAETENMNRVAYREWYPQIVYNHHQTGPAGTVMFAPPFRDPPNHNLHPLMLTNLQQVGSHMHARFVREGKGGTTMRSGASYSTWWNGGLRTTPYYHNMIGLLTETIGNPTPISIPFIPDRQLSHSDLPLPVEPGPWHFRQSVDYSQTANRAVLDFASRNKELLLLNIWTMGRDAIERGSRDSWDNLPREIYAAGEELGRAGDREDFERLLRRPADREPRAYVLPADQPDFPTVVKFVNALLKNGVEVQRATAPFSVGGERYAAGSFVVETDQPFAPHVLDMFEPQDHPDDFAYPGGPPVPPYDLTGWTLAYQMGVEFDRHLEGAEGPLAPVDELLVSVPAGTVSGPSDAAGWLLDVRTNDAFTVVNRVLAGGGEVYRLQSEVTAGEAVMPAGSFWVDAGSVGRSAIASLAGETGVDVVGLAAAPAVAGAALRPLRVGLVDEYGGSMPSGWTRLLLEEFGFDYAPVFPQRLAAGDLHEDFDVLLFPDMGFADEPGGMDAPEDVLREHGDRLGRLNAVETVPAVRAFLEGGGAVIAWGASSELGPLLGLPLRDALVGGDGEPLENTEFFVPGSLLDVRLDEDAAATAGMGARTDVLFARNGVYDLAPGASGVRVVGRFAAEDPLRSGWAWGIEHVAGLPAFFEADVGDGRLWLYTPEVTFRAQAHANFPLLFNAMYAGTAGEARPLR